MHAGHAMPDARRLHNKVAVQRNLCCRSIHPAALLTREGSMAASFAVLVATKVTACAASRQASRAPRQAGDRRAFA
jgi:hypothetical protein